MKIWLILVLFFLFFSCSNSNTENNNSSKLNDIDNSDKESADDEQIVDNEKIPAEQFSSDNTYSTSFDIVNDGMDPYTDIIFGDTKGNVFYSRKHSGSVTKNTVAIKDLLKLDPTGALVWETPLEFPISNEAYVYDYEFSEKSLSILITGTVRVNSKLNMFLIKISATGSPSWVKFIETDGEGWITPYTIAIDSEDNIYVGGEIIGHLSDTSCASDNNKNTRNSDALVMKFDENGNIVWNRQTNKIYTDLVFGMTVDNNDNIYLTGTENISNGDYAMNSSNPGTSMFLNKWDKEGSEIWKIERYNETDQIHGISVGMIDKDVIVLGHRCLLSTMREDGGCNYHPFLARYNGDGEKIWEKRWISDKGPQSVTNATDMVISGDSIYTILDAWERSGHNSDIMLTSFDGNGNKLSNQIITSQCQDYPAHISALPGDAVMITGLTDGWIGNDIATSDCEWEVFRPFVMILQPK